MTDVDSPTRNTPGWGSTLERIIDMETVPQAYVDADADVIHVTGHGCDVPMTFGEARAIRDELTALLLVHDQPAPLPMVGRELLADAYHSTFPNGDDRTRWFGGDAE